jgi:hypothetical protein
MQNQDNFMRFAFVGSIILVGALAIVVRIWS